MATQNNNPMTPSGDIATMRPYWALVADIMGGADAMRKNAAVHLPKFPNEDDSDYEARTKTAPFTAIYEDIARNLTSKPFAREIGIGKKASDTIKAYVENFDGRGNHLNVFAKSAFLNAVNNGVEVVLIDYPDVAPAKTVAEEKARNSRPYAIRIPIQNIIAAYFDTVAGIEILTHIRIYEPAVIRDGFTEKTVERVRIIEREAALDENGDAVAYGAPSWRVLEKRTVNSKEEWVEIKRGGYSVPAIPIEILFIGERSGLTMHVLPPLRSLAHMQIDEFQQEANLKAVCAQSCFPMLVGNGVDLRDPMDANKTIKVPVGAHAVLTTPPNAQGQHGEWKYLEPNAKTIEVLIAKLESARKEMRDIGMQPITSNNITVITSANVSVKASSAVQAWAFLLKDFLERLFKLMGAYTKEADTVEVSVFTDFAVSLETGKELDTIAKLRQSKDLSQRTTWDELQRRGVLSEDFDAEAEELALAEEMAGLEPEQAIDPATGDPINDPANDASADDNSDGGKQQDNSNSIVAELLAGIREGLKARGKNANAA